MPDCWQPGVQYDNGAVVEYEGSEYSIIQPHRSQSDWAPSATPALWSRRQGGGHHGHHGGGNQQQQWSGNNDNKNWQQDNNQGQNRGYDYSQNQQQPQPQQQQQQQQPDQPPQSWIEENKRNLERAGGAAAGLGALGAAYGAYAHHQAGQENKSAEAWSQGNWMNDAKTRTEQFNQNGPTAPVTWVLVHGTNIPQDAIEGGRDGDGSPLYVARAYYEGGVHPGKAGRNLRKGGVIGYGGKEIEVEDYEVLLGNPSSVRWVDVRGNFSASNLGGQPVEGGREKNGNALYIAQAPIKGAVHPGKTNEGFNGAVVPYGGKEEIVQNFRTLVLA